MKTINLKPRSLILINPSEDKAPEIKLKNSNTKRKLTEKQLDALAKGRQKRTQNLKNNKNKNGRRVNRPYNEFYNIRRGDQWSPVFLFAVIV